MKYFFFFAFLSAASSLHAQASTQAITVEFPPRPSGVVISGATLICKGNETILKVEGNYESFEWNTGATERFLRVKEAGVYEVTVKTKGGCTITKSVSVRTISCT